MASGKITPSNGSPRLVTGLTTPGFSKSYPDFPRVACFIGICSIVFEGINVLAYNYIVNNNIKYLGIIFTDFIGDVVVQKALGLNVGNFVPCPANLLTEGCTYCSSIGQCLGCNTTVHYLYDTVTKTCIADLGYYLFWNSTNVNVPILCNIPMIGCLQCSSGTVCTLCDSFANYQLVNGSCAAAPGFYLDNSSIPVKCYLVGCYQCISGTVCGQCSAVNNFIMDISTPTCVCNSSNFFVLDPSNVACIC